MALAPKAQFSRKSYGPAALYFQGVKFELWIHSGDANRVGETEKIATLHDYGLLARSYGERAGLEAVALHLIPAEFSRNANFTASAGKSNCCEHLMVSINLSRSEKFSEATVEAIIAHEIGHLAIGHYRFPRLKKRLSTFFWKLGLPQLAMSWRHEYQADAHALQAVGIEKMQAFYDEVLARCTKDSLTHPNGKRRLKRMLRLQAQRERRQSWRQPLAAPQLARLS